MRACLICEDHTLVRGALVGAIAGRWPKAVILEAGDFPTAWGHATAGPDLILTDLDMPGALPLDGVARLMRIARGAPVVVVTGSHDDAMLVDLLSMGVAGFVPKTSDMDVMLAAIALVLAGGRYLPPRVAELVPSSPAEPAPSRNAIERLTDRQRSVLELIALGRSNKEIALALGLSPATVKTHVAQVLATINAGNRTEAAAKAREARLL
jgi:DNA-binding NarL/FixJ family response regulator